MVLVYNSGTKKWDATLTLTPGATQNLDINGGKLKWQVLSGSKDPQARLNHQALNWGEFGYVTGIGSYGGTNQYKDRIF